MNNGILLNLRFGSNRNLTNTFVILYRLRYYHGI